MSASSFKRGEGASLTESHEVPFALTKGPSFDFGNINVHDSKNVIRVQPKLKINEPGDQYEQEADAMADKVMRMSDPLNQPQSFTPVVSNIQRKCVHCEEEEKEKWQRKESNNATPAVAPSIVHDVLNSSSGKPIDNSTRSFMESRFNYDFGNVKIHDDDVAAKSADSINAMAYTAGNDIVFNQGQYAPDINSGKELLAHELTHVMQQSDVNRLNSNQSKVKLGVHFTNANAIARENYNEVQRNAIFSETIQRQVSNYEVPDLEALPGSGMPQAFADPSSNSDFIDRRINAVGVDLSGANFILFCDGVDTPIALPLDYIEFGNTQYVSVDQFIYSDREEALSHVIFGPYAANVPSQFAYYRAIGGLIVPTRFSTTSSPETMKLIRAAMSKLRGFTKEITDTLVVAVLFLIGTKLVKIGVKRLIIKRGTSSPQKLQEYPDAVPLKTVRPRATPQQLREMIANSSDYYTHRTPEANVAQNQTIVSQKTSLPTAPEGVYLAKGVKGLPYGDYAVSIKGSKFRIRSVPGRAEEFILDDEIPATEGVWYTAEDYAAAKAAVKKP